MGRWAQARHRGRGGPTSSGFLLPPPVVGDDGAMYQDGLTLRMVTYGEFTQDAPAVNLGYRLGHSGAYDEATVVGTATDVLVFSPVVVGQEWDWRMRFCDGSGNPLSDWGDVQTLTVLP